MFLFFNAIVASLDGVIIGTCLKLMNVYLSRKNIFYIFLTNLIIYTIFLNIYYYLNLTFMTKNVVSILYLCFAFFSFFNKEEIDIKQKKLNLLSCILLSLTHSLDGVSISLSFVYKVNIIYIIVVFSIFSIILLLIGYYFANIFKKNKKADIINALLFLFLFISNQFF